MFCICYACTVSVTNHFISLAGLPPVYVATTTIENDSETALAIALKLDRIKMKSTKLLMSGAAATGKTSLIALLLGNPPVLEHESTLLSRPVHHARFTADSSNLGLKWDCYDDPEKLKELLAEIIKDGTQLVHNDPTQPLVQDLPDEPKATPQVSPEDIESYKKTTTFVELVPMMESAVKSGSLRSVHWIYTIDCGGQPAFHDVLPAFIRGHSITMHTLKLNEKLSDPVKMVFSVNGNQVHRPTDLCLSNLQLIKTLVRSAVSSSRHIETDRASEPHFIIVGTFKDEVNEKTIGEVDHVLDSLQLPKDHVLRGNDYKVIFPVNTIVPVGKERNDVAAELRKIIINSYGTVEEPPEGIHVKWVLFELELRRYAKENKHGIISMQECITLGKNFGMNDKVAVKDCVKYLHSQTLVFYFEDVLPKVVFINVQSILDKVSAILFLSYMQDEDTCVPQTLRQQLPSYSRSLKQGLLHEDLLNNDQLAKLSEIGCKKLEYVKFSERFTGVNFLELLQHLLVIARNNKTYFMPCVLPAKPLSNQQKKDFSKQASPLVLYWDDMPVPQGLFPALVVYMLQRNEFELPPKHSEEQQCRYAITLVCKTLSGSIILVDSIEWMEIYYSGQFASSTCPLLHDLIMKGISTIVKKFGYRLKQPKEGFLCQAEACKLSHPHPGFVAVDKNQVALTCSKNASRSYLCSDSHQRCWFLDHEKGISISKFAIHGHTLRHVFGYLLMLVQKVYIYLILNYKKLLTNIKLS